MGGIYTPRSPFNFILWSSLTIQGSWVAGRAFKHQRDEVLHCWVVFCAGVGDERGECCLCRKSASGQFYKFWGEFEFTGAIREWLVFCTFYHGVRADVEDLGLHSDDIFAL